MPDNEFVVRIVDGCERHLTQGQLDRLARITAAGYESLLDGNVRFRYDGLGNCWLVAAVAHGAAMATGLPSKMYGGQVFGEAGEAMFPNGHYWTIVNEGVVVESPDAPTILIWPRSNKALADKRRMVPLASARRGNASMRKLERDLLPLSIAVRDRYAAEH